MIRRRAINSGLPWRVYERFGARRWSIWYQPAQGARTVLLECRADDMTKIEARRLAILKYNDIFSGAPEAIATVVTFGDLADRWLMWQAELPESDDQKYTAETIKTEQVRIKTLKKVFGAVAADEITPAHWYEYQDMRRKKGFGAGCNKEIALASAILEYGRRRGVLTMNTARGIKRVHVQPRQRRLMLAEVDFVLNVARPLGGSALICALAAKSAYLCLRRPSEILSLTSAQLANDGIKFTARKRRSGDAERSGIVEWSELLRATIAEAQAIKRRVDITPYVFGSLAGTVYTKSGWSSNWKRLMTAATKANPEFQRFNLQDGRAGGVTQKEERGDLDTQNVTLHKSRKMIDSTYDRQRVKRGTPAE